MVVVVVVNVRKKLPNACLSLSARLHRNQEDPGGKYHGRDSLNGDEIDSIDSSIRFYAEFATKPRCFPVAICPVDVLTAAPSLSREEPQSTG